jgi:segregation and condensation protein B
MVEAALFSAGRAIAIQEIQDATSLKKEEIKNALNLLITEYRKKKAKDETSFEISRAGDKYVMQLDTKYAQYGKKLAKMEVPKRLLKVLSLIVYYQPVKQSELKGMIGSSIYEHVRELKNLGLIKAKKAGRTFCLETTNYFYEYFGFDTTNKEKIRKLVVKKLQE